MPCSSDNMIWAHCYVELFLLMEQRHSIQNVNRTFKIESVDQLFSWHN